MTSIRDKVDTKQSVTAKLGLPSRKETALNEIWYYEYAEVVDGYKVRNREVAVFEFNAEGALVTHYRPAATPAQGVPQGVTAASAAKVSAEGETKCVRQFSPSGNWRGAQDSLDNDYKRCIRDEEFQKEWDASHEKTMRRIGGDKAWEKEKQEEAAKKKLLDEKTERLMRQNPIPPAYK